MAKRVIIFIVTVFFLISFLPAKSPENLNFKLADTPVYTIGDKDLMFGSIDSLCEDGNENLYILDSKTCKIFKISNDGKLLISWGNRGQGPGDWINGHSIYCLPDGNLALNDTKNYVSIFDLNGKFLKRIFVPGQCLNLSILSEDLFYGWHWAKNDKEQVLVDKEGKTIKKFFSVSTDLFSVNTPDESGRFVKSSHFSYWYSPYLIFTRLGNYTAIGVSNKYEIKIVKTDGSPMTSISRKITADTITEAERVYFEKEVLENRKLQQNLTRIFIKKIPEYKNFYNSIILSNKYVWVSRLRKNAIDEESLYDVDIFDYHGTYKGTFQLKDDLFYAGDKYLYFTKSDKDDNLLVIKQGYTLK
jgi:hypothetical protein